MFIIIDWKSLGWRLIWNVELYIFYDGNKMCRLIHETLRRFWNNTVIKHMNVFSHET